MQKYLSIIYIVFCLLGFSTVQASTYWVNFIDKKATPFSLDKPEEFLSQRAIERRQKQDIAIDSLDLPINPAYRDSIVAMGAIFVHQSRWHNGITVEIDTDSIIDKIRTLSFVKDIEKTANREQNFGNRLLRKKLQDSTTSQRLNLQTSQPLNFTTMLLLDSLHNRGYRGSDVHIAVVDNGFNSVNTLNAFSQTTILGTYDFVQPGNNVYLQGDHGTMVLSTMAAQLTNEYVGTAPAASYYLLRSEDDDTESIREVDAMVAAFEWADSVGADIITSSLGYFYFDDYTTDFTYEMHNGKTLRNSIAATIAARKGILVCISAGNEGNEAWHYISSPSDADSILTVGAVDENRVHSYFSSYGPTADNRIKPEVCAMGSNVSVVHPFDYITYVNGTSFACPITAGMAACLWEALPTLTNLQLRERIIQSASQYTAPDNTLGYGIPNAWLAYIGSDTALPSVEASTETQSAYYDTQGRFMGTSIKHLPAGIYIRKTGNNITKVIL